MSVMLARPNVAFLWTLCQNLPIVNKKLMKARSDLVEAIDEYKREVDIVTTSLTSQPERLHLLNQFRFTVLTENVQTMSKNHEDAPKDNV
jgi:hypothetical protein